MGASSPHDPAAGSAAVAIRGLVRTFRSFTRVTHAVCGIDLDVPAGAAYGLLGSNGAGKTTTIQAALGLVRPTAGSVLLFGRPPVDLAVRRLIGFVPEKFQLPRSLTAREFLQLHATLHGLDGRERRARADEVLARLGLADRQHDRLGTFSKGMQQRAAIAQALLGRPRLLVLDEPTSALDPLGRREVRSLLAELRAEGVTVILNSHILSEVEASCDRVAILQRGRLVHEGALDELGAGSHVVEARLCGDGPLDRLRDALAAAGACQPEIVAEPTGTVSDRSAADAPQQRTLAVTCSVDDEHRVADLAAAAQAAGFGILAIAPRGERLEELFVRLVGTAEAHAGPTSQAGADACGRAAA